MKRAILVRPRAERDLDEQAHYLARHRDVEAALRLYEAAKETFRLLATRPRMGKLAEHQNPLLAGTRMVRMKEFPRHLIFYRARRNGIEVLRIIYGARDIEGLFEA